MKRLWRWLTSARTILALLALLALLLLVNVLVPQRHVVGEEEFARLAVSSRTAHFFLVTLGFGEMASSPVFLVVVALFFLDLAAVLAQRAGATWRRSRMHPRPEAGLRAWAATGEGLAGPLPPGFTLGHAVENLRGFGYQARKAGEGVVWGVRHRTAPLGFLLFHLSFFLLCAGGLAIWATRFVGGVTLGEGQQFGGAIEEYAVVRRLPPLARPPRLAFSLESVESRFEAGEPVHLGAELRFPTGTLGRARVNHPARWGPAAVLVQKAGLAPLLWLQDPQGFTLDRVVVAAATRGEEPTRVPLAEGRFEAVIEPLGPETPFPGRDELADTALAMRVLDGEEVLFEGRLAPGQAANLPGRGRLVLVELRYWAGFLVVSERGGGLLIAGFLLGVAGLVWRLLGHRREVALVWGDGRLTLVGRGEYFPERFQRELDEIFEELARVR